MKIAVINFSGNVGKSTVARHLLAPRMNSASVIPVESINSDGTQDEAIKGKQFGELQEALMLLDDAVVDVGASNVEDFVNLMKQYKGSHEDFDYFVIPTVPKNKQMRDTISTIDALSDIGVPAKKIRLVFNMVEIDDVPERVFAGLFEYHAASKSFTLRPDAVIHVNDIYGKIKGAEQGIKDILNDPTDYKEKIKTAKDSDEKLHFAQMVGIKRLAAGVTEELDGVFKTLFK
ncbi:StbB [Thauera sp. 28]|uniref:StbB family protein n=1 Tax=Thauera sp. 28 TaxID=303682 RepID=UPI0002D0AF4F|nr:StbB family protein [Thauera sp. 28]ENO90954.1 StbB [Thauera sp. 28]